jgi:hypothetical protein
VARDGKSKGAAGRREIPPPVHRGKNDLTPVKFLDGAIRFC